MEEKKRELEELPILFGAFNTSSKIVQVELIRHEVIECLKITIILLIIHLYRICYVYNYMNIFILNHMCIFNI